jgi:MFS family permease
VHHLSGIRSLVLTPLAAHSAARLCMTAPAAGLLADRYGVRKITLLARSLVRLANALLLFLADQSQPVLWIVGFALFGTGGAVHTLLIVALGHGLTGGTLVKAIELLVFAYSGGGARASLGCFPVRYGRAAGRGARVFSLSVAGNLTKARELRPI